MNKVLPIDYQLVRSNEVYSKLITEGKQAVLLTDQVGYGKTYEYLFAIQHMANKGIFANCPVPFPVVIITKAAVVEDVKRKVKDFNLSKVIRLVTNYDQLRSDFGTQFITSKFVFKNGAEQLEHEWFPYLIPRIIILDECHSLKNMDSLQSKIIQSLINTVSRAEFTDLGLKCQFILSSASPFTRLSETKYFMTATRARMRYGWQDEATCTDEHWLELVGQFAGSRTAITDHSPTASKKLREYFKDYIISTKYSEVVESFKKLGRTLHKARNTTLCIPLRTDEQRQFYAGAWERYLEQLAKIDRNAPGGIAQLWVAILKFRMAAEECRAPDLAELAYQQYLDGLSPVVAVNFKRTIGLGIKYLVEKRGISRDKISTIWGGISNDIEDEYEGLELGPQSRVARQKNIDAFQADEADFCFFTFKAGGAGLSLHQHRPEVKRRCTFAAPTYSAIEIVQGLGRVPRITSWSDTEQAVVFYAGTIEEQVAAKMDIKLRSLREVVAANETWAEELVPHDDKLRQMIKDLKPVEDTDDTLAGAYLGEEDDENN